MKQFRFLALGLALTVLATGGCGVTPIGRQAVASAAGKTQIASSKTRQAPANYYQAAEGLQGQALLRTLHNVVYRHKDLGYDQARELMFKDIDDLDNDNVVKCVYIGRALENVTGTKTAFQNGSGLNAEHTWPQSKGAVGPAKSDLHHLFPADVKANSRRGSFPFGEVGQVTWNEGGSKAGIGRNGKQVFEPRDDQKGNTARALLYFYTVYGVDGKADTGNFRLEEETLKKWHRQDPVDATEIARNDAIYAVQGNRNPFVDHPEWVGAVGDFLQ